MRLNVNHSKGMHIVFIRLLLLVVTATLSTLSFAQPDVTNPPANSTLAGTKQVFSWTADDIDVERWWLYVGTSPGSSDISNSGDLGTSTEYNVIGIPVDGTAVHTRLWYFNSSQWRYTDSEFTAAMLDDVQTPAMTSPAGGEMLVNGRADFNWADNNTAVNYWWLYLGSRQGHFDLYNSGPSIRDKNSVTVDQLPTDGTLVHARLWFRTTANGWQYTDYTYGTTDDEPGCITNGGLAGDTGLKTWCWNDVPVASGQPGVDTHFSDRQLVIDAECNSYQVTNQRDRLRFRLDLNQPPASWCTNAYNFRAEVRTAPWRINHENGTEEWFGWSYTFGDEYIADKENPWALFQVHEGTVGESPMVSIAASEENGPGSGVAGELHIVNATGEPFNTYDATGVVPTAGQKIDIVVHVVWGDDNIGLMQVWMDGEQVYSEQTRTVHPFNPVGGNAKFGMYKWWWRGQQGVQDSLDLGIDHMEAFMGPLRILTRQVDDPDYLKNSYQAVAPR